MARSIHAPLHVLLVGKAALSAAYGVVLLHVKVHAEDNILADSVYNHWAAHNSGGTDVP